MFGIPWSIAATASARILPSVFAISVIVLDFHGLGVPLNWPSVGELLWQAHSNPQAPWIWITVVGTVGGILTLAYFIGSAVRNAFDDKAAPNCDTSVTLLKKVMPAGR
jgi:microcin C transport system permease protein